ncbi:transposase [Desulfosediminicola flagellatus]|uniref:transposase n=1 Tax=Desulfosediminicola flagellatus TaxID=2569541 RepID=UPI00142F1247
MKIVGISVLTSYSLFSEIGPDLSKFPSANHFCSWLGLCSNNKICGGKILSSKTRPGASRATQALGLLHVYYGKANRIWGIITDG